METAEVKVASTKRTDNKTYQGATWYASNTATHQTPGSKECTSETCHVIRKVLKNPL